MYSFFSTLEFHIRLSYAITYGVSIKAFEHVLLLGKPKLYTEEAGVGLASERNKEVLCIMGKLETYSHRLFIN